MRSETKVEIPNLLNKVEFVESQKDWRIPFTLQKRSQGKKKQLQRHIDSI